MYRSTLVSLSILLLVLGVSSNDSLPTIRQTANGPVEGIEKISSLGQKYYSFRGIPFAEAPITGADPYTGEQVDRRFKAPVPLKRRWTNSLKVHNFGNVCSQPGLEGSFTTSEDCLFLNVYVPTNGSQHKTVLVWIHGGGFIYGFGQDNYYGPDFLLSQDNIVVTINYRLGIFGFLNLNFGEYTGNMGLKDQQLALKWIHENIEHFSGNKSEVLLFGESAGGAAVQLQMLNKHSRSYFQRAFAASGSAFQPYVFTNADHVQRLQECSNITAMNNLMEYLKTENSSTLIKCKSVDNADEYYDIWVAVVERNDTKNAFLTRTPEEIYNDPEEAPIMDTLFSFTGQEILLVGFTNITESEGSKPLIKENVMETTEKLQLPFHGFTKSTHPKEFEEVLKKLRKAYFSNVTNIDAIKRANAALFSDGMVNYNKIKAISFQSTANYNASKEIGRKNTFLFRFNVTTDLNFIGIAFNKTLTDATHFDDVCYMFHCHLLDEINKYDKHLERKDLNYDLIMRSVKIITNFARTGDPSIEGDTPFKSINSNDEMFCQEVGNELKTSVTNNIQQQLHYNVWHEIEEIYKSLSS